MDGLDIAPAPRARPRPPRRGLPAADARPRPHRARPTSVPRAAPRPRPRRARARIARGAGAARRGRGADARVPHAERRQPAQGRAGAGAPPRPAASCSWTSRPSGSTPPRAGRCSTYVHALRRDPDAGRALGDAPRGRGRVGGSGLVLHRGRIVCDGTPADLLVRRPGQSTLADAFIELTGKAQPGRARLTASTADDSPAVNSLTREEAHDATTRRWLGSHAVVALGCSAASAGPATGQAPTEVPLAMEKDKFVPAELKVKAEQGRSSSCSRTRTTSSHELDISKLRIEKKVRAGQTLKIRMPALKPGKYEIEDDDSTPALKGVDDRRVTTAVHRERELEQQEARAVRCRGLIADAGARRSVVPAAGPRDRADLRQQRAGPRSDRAGRQDAGEGRPCSRPATARATSG